MNQYIGKFVLAPAMVLAVSGIARAHDDDDTNVCNNFTLHGLYVFTASGFNIVSGVAQPKAVVESIRFDGHGNVTVPAGTRSVNGMILHNNNSNTSGAYTVGPDCTGSIQFVDGMANPEFDLFAAFKGSQIQMIQTKQAIGGLPVFQGTAERMSR